MGPARGCSQCCPSAWLARSSTGFVSLLTPPAEPAALPNVCWSGVGSGPSGWAHPLAREGHAIRVLLALLKSRPVAPKQPCQLPPKPRPGKVRTQFLLQASGTRAHNLMDGGESICIIRLDQMRIHGTLPLMQADLLGVQSFSLFSFQVLWALVASSRNANAAQREPSPP